MPGRGGRQPQRGEKNAASSDGRTAQRLLQKQDSAAGPNPRPSPSADQLWNAMDFSLRFPELTLELVSVLKTAEQPAGKPEEEALEFPALVPPDPREAKALRPQGREKAPKKAEDDLSLFAKGRLEPSEPLPPPEKWRGQLWLGLLAAAFLAALLLARFGLQGEEHHSAPPQESETGAAGGN